MPSYKSTVLSDQPIAYWRFGETIAQASVDKLALDATTYNRPLTYSDSVFSRPDPGLESFSRVNFQNCFSSSADDKSLALLQSPVVSWAASWSPSLATAVAVPRRTRTWTELGVSSSPSNYEGLNLTRDSAWIARNTAPMAFDSIAWSPALALFCGCGASLVPLPSGQVFTSADGYTWTSYPTPAPFRSITWSEPLGLFAAVGFQSENTTTAVYTSPDGASWTSHAISFDSPTGWSTWNQIIWAGTKFVAVGTDGSITSDDGVLWTYHSAMRGQSVAWEASIGIVAVRYDGMTGISTIATSTDGINWVNRSSPVEPYELYWSQHLGRFLASTVVDGVGMVSSDGVNWSVVDLPSASVFSTPSETFSLTRTRAYSATASTSPSYSLSWADTTFDPAPPVATRSLFEMPLTKFSLEMIVAPSNTAGNDSYQTILSYGSELVVMCTSFLAPSGLLPRTLYVKLKGGSFINTGVHLLGNNASLLIDGVEVPKAPYTDRGVALPTSYFWNASWPRSKDSTFSGFSSKTFPVWMHQHHLVLTWESLTGKLKVYQAGSLKFETTTALGQSLASGQRLTIGAEYDGASYDRPFYGTVDEISIYDKVLDDGRIIAHYQAAVEGTDAPLPSTTKVMVEDVSPNDRDGWYFVPELSKSQQGLVYTSNASSLYLPSFPLTSAFTLEEWLVPSLRSSVTKLMDGPISLQLVDGNKWQFMLSGSTWTGYLGVTPDKPTYVTLSHTFGAGKDTLLAVNGTQVAGSWAYAEYTASFNESTDLVTTSVDVANLSRVRFTSSNTLPSPLTTNTDYWTIRQSATTSKLATSRSNAGSGIFINLTSSGSGSHTVRVFQGDNLPPFPGEATVVLNQQDKIQQLRISAIAKTIESIQAYFGGLSE